MIKVASVFAQALSLINRRELRLWLDKPYQSPALGPAGGQLLLFGS